MLVQLHPRNSSKELELVFAEVTDEDIDPRKKHQTSVSIVKVQHFVVCEIYLRLHANNVNASIGSRHCSLCLTTFSS